MSARRTRGFFGATRSMNDHASAFSRTLRLNPSGMLRSLGQFQRQPPHVVLVAHGDAPSDPGESILTPAADGRSGRTCQNGESVSAWQVPRGCTI